MIIVKLIGGLGNQMFQYAAGRALALKHGVNLKLDVSQLNKEAGADYTQRKLELEVFNCDIQIATNDELAEFNYLKNKQWLRFLQRKIPFAFSKLYFAESGNRFQIGFTHLPQSVYLDGFWQSERYFIEIRDNLFQAFQPKVSMPDSIQTMFHKIKSSKSVSIHVRRGDYVSLSSANAFHGLCSIDYYQNAIQKMTTKFGEIEIFVFSDDTDWCINNLIFNCPTSYIKHSEHAVWDLYLMSQCQHNVIANSSFSWWAAWLNQHPNKTVLVPEYWYTNIKSNSINILAKDWEPVSG